MDSIPKLKSVRPYVSKRKRKDAANEIPQIPAKQTTYDFNNDIFLANDLVYQNSLRPQNNAPSRRHKDSTRVCEIGPLWKVEWCKKHSHLLACAGGNSIKLYNCIDRLQNVWSSLDSGTQIRDIVWSRTCKQILSCTFSKQLCERDFLNGGKVASTFQVPEVPSVIRYWPENDNVILVGGKNAFLASYDLRSCKLITNYNVEFGSILDMDVLTRGNKILTTTDAISRESASHSIVVWDFATGAKISDQIFHEKFSCPKLCVHPSGSSFLAQTNGDYIARFSTYPPYKLDKYVRYENHLVEGYPIGLDISCDGKVVVSGSSDGNVCFYKFKDASLISKIGVRHKSCTGDDNAIITAKYHPVMASLVAVGDWSGNLHLLQ